MKTLIFLVFSSFSCLGQNFLMRMDISEIYDSSRIDSKNVKVVWGIDYNKDISFIWDEKILFFTKKQTNPTIKQIRLIKKIEKKYEPFIKKKEEYLRISAIYLNEKNEVFYIRIHANGGILIWIHRLDGKFPCYFFKWDGVVKVQNYP